MNKLIKIALVTVTTLSLGLAAFAHADEAAAPGSEKHCKGGKGFHRGGPRSAEWQAKKNAMLNSLTAAELKQVGLTDDQIKAFESCKLPFVEQEPPSGPLGYVEPKPAA